LSSDEAPPLDAERIFATLDRHGVVYLLVGGLSATTYGARRVTKDFDCLPARNEQNLRLSDYEARQLPVQLDHVTLGSMEISTWRTDAGDLDVLCDIPACDGQRQRYEDLEPRSTEAVIGKVTVRLASLDDVIESKRWADREKDREALDELDELRSRLARPSQHGGQLPLPPSHRGTPSAPDHGVEL
jgi:hypothetical protein